MRNGRCWWLSLAGVVILGSVLVRADSGPSDQGKDQRNPSHIPIPLHGMDLQQALAERVQLLKDTSKAKEYLREFLEHSQDFVKDQQNVDELLELLSKGRLPFDPNDPGFQKLKQDYADKKQRLAPEQQEKLDLFIKKVEDDHQALGARAIEGGPLSPDGNGGGPPPGGDMRPQDRMPIPSPGGHPPIQGPAGGFEAEPSIQEKLAGWLAEHVDPEAGSWVDSPALRETIRELRRPHLEMGDWSGLDENSWTGKFAGWGRSALRSDFWPKLDLSRFDKLNVPGKINLPKLNTGWQPRAPVSMPNVALPPASTLNRGLELLWVGLIGLLVVVIWKFLRAQAAHRADPKGHAWKLGSWPVQPSEVANRKELILAFEYLSLLKLGQAARSRNHRALGAMLAALGEHKLASKSKDNMPTPSRGHGTLSNERRRAADHLAALYEVARYAPEPDPISDDALMAARRELCLLAGTARA